MRFIHIVILSSRRLNAHLSSIVSSKPFQMPVDVIPRTTALGVSRLSSFGFSGTIAHGAFSAQSQVSSHRSVSSMPTPLYRQQHHLSRVQNVARLYIARGVRNEPISILAGRPAVYCNVQTIPSPEPCKCVTQKTMQATEMDQDHKDNSIPPLNRNIIMGSWKRLLRTAQNVSRDF